MEREDNEELNNKRMKIMKEEELNLFYRSEFISVEEEKELWNAIDLLPWSNELKRRVQHYGKIKKRR